LVTYGRPHRWRFPLLIEKLGLRSQKIDVVRLARGRAGIDAALLT
jgi:hypothetical protein